MNEQNLIDYLIKNKEVYQLWFEYLKENEPYKEFCELIRKEKIQKLIFYNHTEADKTLGKSWHDYYKVWWYWKDVNLYSWEGTYQRLQVPLNNYYIKSTPLNDEIFEYIEDYQKQRNHDPSVSQIKGHIDLLEKKYNPIPKPTNNLPEKEIRCLWQYLNIYRTRKNNSGLSWKEVRDIVDPLGTIYRGVCFTDQCREAHRKAQRIIENVGKNIFPGIYAKLPKIKKTKKQSKKAVS